MNRGGVEAWKRVREYPLRDSFCLSLTWGFTPGRHGWRFTALFHTSTFHSSWASAIATARPQGRDP